MTAIEQLNASAALFNQRAEELFKAAAEAPSGLKPNDEQGWSRWWFDKAGYRYEPPEQQVIVVDAAPQLPPPFLTSCFAGGTMVHTLDGRRPIESLRVGDQVLSQDATNGVLSFQPVMVVHHNPPAECVALAFDDGETVTASIYHRFYRAGKGWAQARELAPGDVVRTLGGSTRVASASRTGPILVYNLDVATTRTFFVGGRGLLVHDNTQPDPRAALFDAAAADRPE